jgi:oxalate decarboxylase/phosphoglucose isomerase-like protein (cupin superfamily)
MKLIAFETDVFRSHFGSAPFLVRHRLTQNQLFSLPALVALARRLPASSVEYNAGDVPLTLDPARTPRNGLSPQETIRRIEQCRSWLVLKNVEQDPAYRLLLERCLAEVGAVSEGLSPGMSNKEGFIFVSSPGSVTPYHMDPEENFLLQVRGHKTMHVFDPADRSVLSEHEIERFLSGAHRNLVFRDEYRSKGRAFELRPGWGVHVPVTAPHWVQNGAEVSISFSITFQTKATLRYAHAHRLNAGLRRWGLRPSPVGQSALRDRLKQLLFRAAGRAARVLAIATTPGSARGLQYPVR